MSNYDDVHGTIHEMRFLDNIGSFKHLNDLYLTRDERIARKLKLLRNYLSTMHKRVRWDKINSKKVAVYCKFLINKYKKE